VNPDISHFPVAVATYTWWKTKGSSSIFFLYCPNLFTYASLRRGVE
jgi:hypothetical protein